MTHLTLPDTKPRRLPFFLAMEEWAARHLPAEEDYLFTWVVGPTVICGRHQDIAAEVDLDFCRKADIDIVRRRSGGGAVFANADNIMVSLVTADTDVERAFARFTRTIATQLRHLGIDAEVSGRNDITVGGRKISGSAFLHLPGRSVVHCTMLFDTDAETMRCALTPARAKLLSKGVTSVESRIVTARELMPSLTRDALREGLLSGLTTGERRLTEAEVAEIEAMAREYDREDWLWRHGRDHGAQASRTMRIESAGTMTVRVAVDAAGRIADVKLSGDFFERDADALAQLLSGLRGVAPTAEALCEALRTTDVSRIISGLSTEQFINLITNN